IRASVQYGAWISGILAKFASRSQILLLYRPSQPTIVPPARLAAMVPSLIPIARRRLLLHRHNVAGLGIAVTMQFHTASVELTNYHLDSSLNRRMVCAVAGDEFLDNGPQRRGRQ
ncbi:hypothetical protein LCGC14_1507050, partial [marine sediment metagenome]